MKILQICPPHLDLQGPTTNSNSSLLVALSDHCCFDLRDLELRDVNVTHSYLAKKQRQLSTESYTRKKSYFGS